MYFEQFYLESLGHASYLVGDESTGQALLVDPRRDVDGYFAAARGQGLRVSHVVDSHGHNDYLSGLAEVVARADAEVLGSAAGDLGYPHRPVEDGETVQLGDVAVEVMHTPGHTPEHVCLLVRDLSVGDHPALLLSGGALLVGDVGRPDLLGGEDAVQQSARQMCGTVRDKLLALPDELPVFPTHVAGSLCGGSIGSRLSTTIGYERRTNDVLARVDGAEGTLVDCLTLDALPAVPPYWRRMRRQNLDGVAGLGVLAEPPALSPSAVLERLGDVVTLDTRQPEAYGGGHVPGALNVGLGASFATWAGTVVPEDADVLLVVDDPADVWEATWQLLRIGYRVPVGWLAGGMFAWRSSGAPLERLAQITVDELRRLVDDQAVDVLDVRQPGEWASGHIDGAVFVTGAELPSRLDDVPDGRTTAVVCGSGYRSSAAASLLARAGRGPLLNVLGGMSAWRSRDYPTTA